MATLPATLEVDASGASPGSNGVTRSTSVGYHLKNKAAEQNSAFNDRSISFTPAQDVTIGRDKSQCQLAFPDCAVLSRTHCRIFSMGRDVFVHDYSSNGTFVNGKKMGKGNKTILRAGDVVSVVNPAQPGGGGDQFAWTFIPPKEEEVAMGGLQGSYHIGKTLGTGNFATVKLGTSKLPSGTGGVQKEVAVKIIEKKRFALNQDAFSFSALQHEVEILRKMNHKNIIGIHDVYDDPAHFTMVLELIRHGDLFDYIVGRSPTPFSEAEAKHLFIQLVEAMLYMHSKEVVHRDLKPENILVSVDPSFKIPGHCDDHQKNAKNVPVNKVTLKITDFGLAKFCSEHEVMTTMCGTPAYLAPEVLLPSKSQDKKAEGYKWGVDVWSLGVILYILLSGTPPSSPHKGNLIFNKYFNGVSEEAKQLVMAMLQVNPAVRADLSDIVNHSWLKGCIVEGKELAIKIPRLDMAQTMMLQASPTVTVNPEVVEKHPSSKTGGDTDCEESDDDEVPSPTARQKRLRDDVAVVVWQWKKFLEKDDKAADAWEDYTPSWSEQIEKAKTKGSRSTKVSDDGMYRISFDGMFQYNKMDTSKQRPVRRIVKKGGGE